MLEALILTTLVMFPQEEPPVIVEPVQAAAAAPIELEMLAIDLRALSRMAELADDLEDHDGLMRKIVNARIDDLREPRSDGSYRWASLKREEASRDTKEEEVERVYTEETLDRVTLDGHDGYRIEIEAPRKKSLFSSNERIFVKRIVISRVGEADQEVPASVWIDPGSSWGAPLPAILEAADVSVELGVETGREDGVAKVSILRAKLVDDPRSPYFPAVTKMLDIRDALHGSIDRGKLQRAIDEAISTIPGEVEKTLKLEAARASERMRMLESGEMSGTVMPGDASPDVILILKRINSQLESTLEDQEQGRTELKELIEMLSPETDAIPEPMESSSQP